jgi:hypothetical protein
LTNFFTQRYSRQGLWSLFLMSAFVQHAWTLILVFRDMDWMTARTNFWDALGVAGYALVFAFVESLVLFLVIALLGFLVSTAWDQNKRVALLSVLILIASLWAALGQLYFLIQYQPPVWLLSLAAHNGHPIRVLYGIAILLVTPTLALPAWFMLRSEGFLKGFNSLAERLSLLAGFYLFFDLLGLIYVIVRNVF